MKPPLVLLAGTLCNRQVFGPLRRRLSPQIRVYPVDFDRFQDPGKFCDALLAQLPERFSVAGFSLGGFLALQLLRRAPQRVERIALIASNAQPSNPVIQQKSKALKSLWKRSGPKKVIEQLMPNYFFQPLRQMRHRARVVQMARQTRRRTAFAHFDLAAQRASGHATLAAFAGPVLVVSGAKDKVCPPRLQQAIVQSQPRTHWTEIRRVGHFVPLEAPGHLGHALQRWMRLPGTT